MKIARATLILVAAIVFAWGGTGCRKSSKQAKRGAEELLGALKKANRDYKAAHQCVCFGFGSVPCMSCGGGGFKPAMQMTPYGPMSVLEPCGFALAGASSVWFAKGRVGGKQAVENRRRNCRC